MDISKRRDGLFRFTVSVQQDHIVQLANLMLTFPGFIGPALLTRSRAFLPLADY